MMGAVSSLVTGAYGTMCECFFYRVVINPFFVLQGYSRDFSVNLYKEYTSLKSRELEELPRFQVMSWQPF